MKDRIVGLRRVRGAELIANAKNWRRHDDRQRAALGALVDKVGFAGALLARELEGGGLELIDGHMRAEELADEELPVLVLDLDAQETELLLATYDPLGAMAHTDDAALKQLVNTLDAESRSLHEWLLREEGAEAALAHSVSTDGAGLELPRFYQVLVECESEDAQRSVYERLSGEGLQCRLLQLSGM